MRTTIFFLLLAISKVALTTTIEGTLITQIKGITDNITILCSSNPDVARRPRPDGSYSAHVASSTDDYLIIIPERGDDNLYSPRIIRAAEAATDTLYIIPPTNQTLSIIVDNKTGKDLKFVADKAVILDELVTSEKDYQLTILPRRARQAYILIAAFASSLPAVVRKVDIMPDQNKGYLVIERQDMGLAPLPASAPRTIHNTARMGERSAAPPQAAPAHRTSDAGSRDGDRTEEMYVPMPPQTDSRSSLKREQTLTDASEPIIDTPSAYYFSDGLILKDKMNSSLAVRGGYQAFPDKVEAVQLVQYGIEFYNVRILRNYFDFSMRAMNSEQLADVYYRGSFVWHQSSYADIDFSYKLAPNNVWYSQYDATRMSLGVNGCYKSQGEKFQIGAGVRFQVDYGDFDDYFDDAASKFRYRPSFYLIMFKSFGGTTASLMAGIINEAAYASAAILIARHIGVTYTFKDKSLGSTPLNPLEKELCHKVTLEISMSLKKRQ
jgi:hypothetical protein